MTSANISHRLLALVLLVSAAPIVPGLSDPSAGAPLGSAPPRIERQVALGSGPAGHLPVVERHVSGDSVVDWLEEPPADAAEAMAGPADPGRGLGDVGPGAAASEADPSSGPAPDPAPDAVPVDQVEAANGGTSYSSSAPGQGFAVFSTSPRWIPAGYSIRLTGADARVEQFRDELEAAAAAAETATGTRVRVAAGRGGAEQPSRGEITVVVGSGPCGGGAIGCGGPAMTSSEIVSGRIWIYPNGLSLSSSDRRHLAAHELGHALGLQHYNGLWEGARQTMYPTTQGITSFRSGDVGGLRYMAGLHDRPAGTVTGRSYVAGQMRVTGSVTSGSKVRVTVGSASQDVTVSGGGFTAAVPAPAGSHQVCALVLDAASGFRRNLGCATVSAPGAPFGNLESVSGSFESIVVSGWAIDPQTADSVKVEVRRGSALLATATSDASRPDVGGAYSGYGDRHGFRLEVPAVAGSNTVCVRVLGVGAGGDVDLGCRKVVHAVQPVGAFELAAGGTLTAKVSGWALDPNTPGAVQVQVAVDGTVPAAPGSFAADEDRSDVGRAFPAHGPAHGFAQELVLTPGSHSVCLTVRNVGLGQDLPLGCRKVVVTPGGVGQILAAVPAPTAPTSGVAPVVDKVGTTLSGTVSALLGPIGR